MDSASTDCKRELLTISVRGDQKSEKQSTGAGQGNTSQKKSMTSKKAQFFRMLEESPRRNST